MKASVIISVYKNVQALYFVLESLRYQTETNFEIIISEDGNSNLMKDFINNYNWFCKFKHITQPDNGWNKNAALNKSILVSSSEYLIFIDGDCIVNRRFVEMHLYNSSPNRILLGKRVKLSAEITANIYNFKVSILSLPRLMFRYLIFRHGCRFTDEGIVIPFLLKIPFKSTHMLKGCNMSFSKNAILSINGFNEDFKLPSIGEDEDIDWRFRAKNYKFRSVRNRANVYHLYHKGNWNGEDRQNNLDIMRSTQKKGEVFCLNGINKYNKNDINCNLFKE